MWCAEISIQIPSSRQRKKTLALLRLPRAISWEEQINSAIEENFVDSFKSRNCAPDRKNSSEFTSNDSGCPQSIAVNFKLIN